MFEKLFAVCLLVKDLEVSTRFYKDILGLELNSQDDGFTDFKMEGTSLAIFQKDKAVSMFPERFMGQTGGCVLAFQVEDVNESCKQLKQRGVEMFEGPKTTSWGQVVAYFKDPDGNIWEVSGK
ncbi:MAG: hypothetical protein A2418_00790 [Candidatus Brennerbacteria bacterium RIFOXYC1_FULL_41_11]|uniref:VOC domain-containing protein n=1 Tax=Candidatus Brennerbacteria bacterium RIFOXYD1_FULL_41_16 TaxID=1797529 RepID=A0A1G1XMF0_9BACT|nr:MAG: hypothetical protein A2391_03695 [Candidatus Brennerbacteria bacterium RIFOXYB1_FULL_41_13]OGY40417.1 MAG: hypothetical protein A2418_00790 [Candidatus Brennerbacteria bacterium RIFOXYC1_FULL_41_11]OGY40846.1 MAG: hypothetical protein A2570_00325 [Candidatus Brennerbacteria bacterium RIFOXYD1_FULL_41_16]